MIGGMGFVAGFVCLVIAGCSTPNVNPPAPRAHTGYVDFHTDSSLGLTWRIKRANEVTGEMKTVFSDYTPFEDTVLRLAAPPGTHRFQLYFMNEVTEGPATVSVPVVDGKVTPVHVTLTPAGSSLVDNKSYEYRPTVRASRRVTRIVTEENVLFHIGAVAGTPQEYQPKERMPYYSSPPN